MPRCLPHRRPLVAGLRRTLGLAVLVVLATASPAGADPAKPTDYRSTIDRIEPSVAGYSLSIVGGDSFLELQVEPGHEVVVYAYATGDPDGRGEPFLRVRSDGVVEENRQSPYTYLIEDRYARTSVPASVDADNPPEWQAIGSGGTATWHDHRIHWMSPDRKPGVAAGDVVQTWSVPLRVDDTDVTVEGTLVLEHPISPLPWLALGAIVLTAVLGLGRGRSVLVASVATLAAAATALFVGVGEYANVPSGAGPSALTVALPAVGLLAAGAALALRRTRVAVVGTLAAVAVLGGWAVMRVAVLFKPVLPTGLPFGVDRAGTAATLAVAVAAAVLAVRSGALVPQLAPLEDD